MSELLALPPDDCSGGQYPVLTALASHSTPPPPPQPMYYMCRVAEHQSLDSGRHDNKTSSTSGSCHDDEADDGQQQLSYHDNVAQWLNQQCGGGMAKRKRKVSRNQRVAANQRERRRMGTFNQAFERLRETVNYNDVPADRCSRRTIRKMSRIQTLKTAIQYISDLTQLLDDTNQYRS